MARIALTVLVALCLALPTANGAEPLKAGFAAADITPDMTSRRGVWLAGYLPHRRATGVHDRLYARAVVLAQGDDKIALVSLDVVGLMYPTVQQIRRQLPGFRHVLVASTHNHEGPDTIGLWGAPPFLTGIDPDYLNALVHKTVAAVRQADERAIEARARYGTANSGELLGDSRLPKVLDPVLRALRITDARSGKTLGLVVQWNCHPESLGAKNTLITADFPFYTVEALSKRYDCPVVYFSGALGGLMAPPVTIQDAGGRTHRRGNFEYAQVYGTAVAALAAKAVDASTPIRLAPLSAHTRRVVVPLVNPVYQMARSLGLVERPAWQWTGDATRRGRLIDTLRPGETPAIETEVALLRLGELQIVGIPGEIYPELVGGGFQNPVDPAVDFPQAPHEPTVDALLGDKKRLLLGLANDEIGYLIPKCQWDQRPPYAYGRLTSQYGEVNSVGPDAAAIIMRALAELAEADSH